MGKVDKEVLYNHLVERLNGGYWLSYIQAEALLKNEEKISLDANFSFKKINPKTIVNEVGFKNLKKVVKSKVYYYFDKNKRRLIKISIYDPNTNYYYKLYPTNKAPTIEISGVRMHRTVEVDPWQDSMEKVLSVVNPRKKYERCLDTCMGAGYTATWLSRFCDMVFTVEKDENVIQLLSWNPWAKEMLEKDILFIKIDQEFDKQEFVKTVLEYKYKINPSTLTRHKFIEIL